MIQLRIILIISIISHVRGICVEEYYYRSFTCSIDDNKRIHVQMEIPGNTMEGTETRAIYLHYKNVPFGIAEDAISQSPWQNSRSCAWSQSSENRIKVDCDTWDTNYSMYYPSYRLRMIEYFKQENVNGNNETRPRVIWKESKHPYRPHQYMCACANYYKFHEFNYTDDREHNRLLLTWRIPYWLSYEQYRIVQYYRGPDITKNETLYISCDWYKCQHLIKFIDSCVLKQICVEIKYDKRSKQCVMINNKERCSNNNNKTTTPPTNNATPPGLTIELSATIAIAAILLVTVLFTIACVTVRWKMRYSVEVVQPRDKAMANGERISINLDLLKGYTEIVDCVDVTIGENKKHKHVMRTESGYIGEKVDEYELDQTSQSYYD